MRQDELREALREQPFEPFRMHLTNGLTYQVRHPEMALLTPRSVHVVKLTKSGHSTNRVVQCDLIHVVAIEPLNGRNGRQPRAPRRHRG